MGDPVTVCRWLLAAGLFSCMRSIPKAWIGPRTCPPAPLLPRLAFLPSQSYLYFILLSLLPMIACTGDFYLTVGFAVLGTLLSVADWTRFRPFFYQYTAMLLALSLSPNNEGLRCCCLVHVSIYFWSGVLKLNADFFNTQFPFVMEPVSRGLPLLPWRVLSYLAPIFEACFAAALLFPGWRAVGLGGAVMMHGLLIFCFSRPGQTGFREVLPWNLSMLLLDLALFGNSSAGPLDIMIGDATPLHLLLLGIFALLPAFGLLDRLDPVFSHGHMSGRHVYAGLFLRAELMKNLPPEIQAYCVRLENPEAFSHFLDFSQWYRHELYTPAPQLESCLKRIAAEFIRYGANSTNSKMMIYRTLGFKSAVNPKFYDLA